MTWTARTSNSSPTISATSMSRAWTALAQSSFRTNDDDGNRRRRAHLLRDAGRQLRRCGREGRSSRTGTKKSSREWCRRCCGTYFGSPTGMVFYEGTLLPKKYQGQLLHCDAGPREVRCYHLKPKGAGYELDREDMVTSTDSWFRPSAIRVAPDGSVFVADWYDPGVGGHGMGDTTRGRVYRLAPKGSKHTLPNVDFMSEGGLLAALGSPNLATRFIAVAAIGMKKPEAALDFLVAMTSPQEATTSKGRALWQIGRTEAGLRLAGASSERALTALSESLRDADGQLRILAQRVMNGSSSRWTLHPLVVTAGNDNVVANGLRVLQPIEVGEKPWKSAQR